MRVFVIGSYINANVMRVPRLPAAGESIAATSLAREHGGKGFNLAVGLHRLGASTRLLMAVGRDENGASVRRDLEAMGIDVSLVKEVEGASGFGVGFVTPQGNNFLSIYAGANLALAPEDVVAAAPMVHGADWVAGQFEAPDIVLLEAFRLARRGAAATYLNPSPWRAIDDELLAMTDVLVMNEAEAACFFREPSLEEAPIETWRDMLATNLSAFGWRGKWLIVTLGKRGAIGRFPTGDVEYVSAFAIDQIDATGAGDAFGAGLIMALSKSDPQEALAFANACGAMVARREGVWRWLPDYAEATAFLGGSR